MLSPWFGASSAFNEMDAVRREMATLMRAVDAGHNQNDLGPEVHMVEDEEAWRLVMDVPGLSAEDLDVVVQANRLTLQGSRAVEAPEGYRAHRRERRAWRFSRNFRLPPRVDADGVTAEVSEGVLTVLLPKQPALQPRQISVQTV